MTKGEAIKRLEVIVKHSKGGNYNYRIKANDWEKRDPETNEVVKARTYLSIAETRENSKHYAEKRYGYIDNLTGEYVVEKNDMMENYNFGGNGFDEK